VVNARPPIGRFYRGRFFKERPIPKRTRILSKFLAVGALLLPKTSLADIPAIDSTSTYINEFINHFSEHEIQLLFVAAIIIVVLIAAFITAGARSLALKKANEQLTISTMEKIIALEQLGQSRASLANAQRIARLGNWDLDLGTGETKWSDEVYRILGLIPINTTPSLEALKKCIHADDRSRFSGLIERSIKTGKPFSADHRIIMPDGAIRFVHQQGEVIKNPGNTPDTIKGVIIDITEREMAAAEIRKLNVDLERRVADRTNKLTREINERNKAEIRSRSERARAERYLSIAGTIIVALDKNGRIEMINKKGCDVLGYEESELLGRDWFSAVLPIDISNAVRTLYGQLIETHDSENTFQNKIVTKSGEHRIISWENTTLRDEHGNASGVLSAGMDITDHVEAENKIISSERLYRSILGTTSQGYWLIDENFIIKDVNPALCRMLGYSKNEMTGFSITSFVDEESRKTYNEYQRNIENSIQQNYEITLNHKNGHRINAKINATKMHIAPDGNDVLRKNDSFAFINDITEQKRIESAVRDSEERFRAIADYTYDWESWIGLNGSPVWVNPAVERMCEYTADECLSMDDYPLPLVFKADHKIVKHMINDSISGGTSSDTEFRIKTKSGKIIWVSASYQPIFDMDGKQNGSRWSARDISVRKAINAQLILAKDSAEAANRAKSGFLSNMSHELRTPLNAILGFSQMLDAEMDNKLSGSQKEYVGYILKSGSHLLNLINEILDLSKIEAGSIDLNIDQIATDEIIADTVSLLGATTAERNIKISNNANAQNTPITMADGVRLKQVMTNIISNAIKFNRDDGCVTIDTQIGASGKLQIIVTDEGNGVPIKRRYEMFQPFSRLDAENSGTEGTGVGLVITKKLVEMMGGTVGFDSIEGLGSRFWIEMPIAEDAMNNYTSTDGPCVNQFVSPRINHETKRAIYIVDKKSDADTLINIANIDASIEIIPAPSVRLGIELAEVHCPDLFIIDQTSPAINGKIVVNWVQEQEKYIPAIAVINDSMENDAEIYIKDGFSGIVKEPIDQKNILHEIYSVLNKTNSADIVSINEVKMKRKIKNGL